MVPQPKTDSHIRDFSPRVSGFYEFAKAVGLDLEPFQRKIVRAVVEAPERESLILLGRGGGKTTLVAALAVWHLLVTPRPQVIVGAASAAQATILYEAAREFASHPTVSDRMEIRHLKIRLASGTGTLLVVPANGPRVHGFSPSLAICDELHAHRDDSLYLALRTALAKRPDARMVSITTASELGDTPLSRLRARALASPQVSRRGPLVTASGAGIKLLEWSAPEDADPADLKMAKRVNPATWISHEALREQQEALPEAAWRRYHLNMFVADESCWLPPGAWQAIVGQPEIEPGSRIWVGIDAGGGVSDSVVAWVDAEGNVGVAIHEGEDGSLRCSDTLRELAAEHRVVEAVFDPWNFGSEAQHLEREGLPMVRFDQTDQRMAPASERLRRAVLDKTLTVPDDPRLAGHAATAITRTCRRNGWRIDKPRREDRVDALIALAMALDRRETAPEPVALLGWL